MTTDQHRNYVQTEELGDLRRNTQQAAVTGAALRGDLGVDAQLLAMSEQYKALRAAGKLAEAQAVRAAAIALVEGH